MSGTRSSQVLFREWRGGDATSGQVMAQRFADWYYAITTSRLGETAGRVPCETSCAQFGQGIVHVTEARDLVPWAHKIVQDQLATAGNRADDGDEPNIYTGNQRPKVLLSKSRVALPAEVALLEAAYGKADKTRVDELAAPMGGNPLGVLKARYRVKQWLRDNEGVPFEVAPDNPILDRKPLPMYESAKMATPEEEANFEQWMISDIDLCKDIAEFAHFAIALRGGLPSEAEVASQIVPKAAPDDPDEEEFGGSNAGIVAAVGGVTVVGGMVVLALIVLATAAFFLYFK